MGKGWPTGQMGRFIKGSLKTGWLLAMGSSYMPTAMPMLASRDRGTDMAMGFRNMASNDHGGGTNTVVVGSGTSGMGNAPILFTHQRTVCGVSGSRGIL